MRILQRLALNSISIEADIDVTCLHIGTGFLCVADIEEGGT